MSNSSRFAKNSIICYNIGSLLQNFINQNTKIYMNDSVLVGNQIKKAREAKGLSILQLANKVGVEEDTLLNWESESRSPRANRLIQISGILGVPLAWLMAGEGDSTETDYYTASVKETARIETKLDSADQLIGELSALVADLRGQTRKVQKDIDVSS